MYFESGEFGAFLIECWSACRQGESDDGGDDDRCFLFYQNVDDRYPIFCSRAGPEYRRCGNETEEVMEQSQ